MSPLWFAVVFLGSVCHLSVCRRKDVTGPWFGGWTKLNPKAPKLLALAYFATSSQTKGDEYYYTVVDLFEAEQQIVAGMRYRLKMKVARSVCEIAETKFDPKECVPQSGAPVKVCTAIVVEVPWKNLTAVQSFNCEP